MVEQRDDDQFMYDSVYDLYLIAQEAGMGARMAWNAALSVAEAFSQSVEAVQGRYAHLSIPWRVPYLEFSRLIGRHPGISMEERRILRVLSAVYYTCPDDEAGQEAEQLLRAFFTKGESLDE